MTKTRKNNEANKASSQAAFIAAKAQFDALLAELAAASADHFGADPDENLWGHVGTLNHRLSKLRDIADSIAHRGEYAA